MALPEGIEINPKVMLGKPVIRGTRIPVELLLRKLGESATEQDLLDAYPNVKGEDIRDAMAHADPMGWHHAGEHSDEVRAQRRLQRRRHERRRAARTI